MAEVLDAPTPTRRGRKVLPAAVVLGGVAVSAAGLWWVTHPSEFDGATGLTVTWTLPVGETGTAEVALLPRPGAPEVSVHDVEPRILRNDADATVRVGICRGSTVGAARGGIEEIRGNCEHFQRGETTPLRHDDSILVEVTGQKHGTVVIDGVRVRYSSGWQRGSEDTGVRVATRFGAKR
jgi:hypothetical protein